MNRIIVTIRIKQKKEYDLELPVHQKIKDLMNMETVRVAYDFWILLHRLTRNRSVLWIRGMEED